MLILYAFLIEEKESFLQIHQQHGPHHKSDAEELRHGECLVKQDHSEQGRCHRLNGGDLGSPGGFQPLQSPGVEDIGRRAGEQSAEDRKKRGPGILRRLRQGPVGGAPDQIGQRGDTESIKNIRVDRVAPVQDIAAENTVQGIPEPGPETKQQTPYGQTGSSSGDPGNKGASKNGEQDADHLLPVHLFPEQDRRKDQHDGRRGVKKGGRRGDLRLLDRHGVAGGKKQDTCKTVQKKEDPVFLPHPEHGTVPDQHNDTDCQRRHAEAERLHDISSHSPRADHSHKRTVGSP